MLQSYSNAACGQIDTRQGCTNVQIPFFDAQAQGGECAAHAAETRQIAFDATHCAVAMQDMQGLHDRTLSIFAKEERHSAGG